MKKLRFAFVLLLCLGVFLCLCSSAYAEPAVIESGTCGAEGDNLTWTLYDTGELVIDGTGAMSDYGEGTAPWYKNRLKISAVTIHDGVTSIGSYAFYYNIKLEAISIPDTVETIGNNAFDNCTKLSSVTIPETVTSIESYTFSDCNRLKSVTIPEGVTSIGFNAFYGCSSLTSVTIPDSVASIGYYAFSGCSGLTSVTIPEGVTSIGNYTFYGCSSLTSVTIPEGVTSIGRHAFDGCSGLTSIHITSLETWYSNSFGVKFPGSYDLYLNDALVTELIIPESVTRIGNSAFYGCSSLTSVTIPESVTSIGDGAFKGCSSLTAIHITSLEVWCGINFGSGFPKKFNLYLNDALVTELIIPDSVTSLGRYAFYGCSSLTSVTIPESVMSIGDYAFGGCSGLTSVTIPWGVTSIGNDAFNGSSSLTSVTIPEGVTSIGDYAFGGCSGLTSVTIPWGVTSIGEGVFCDCSGLTSVTIPESVTSIGDWAFYGCSDLTDVYYGGSEAQWETISIGYSNEPLTNATIHYGLIPEIYTISYDSNGGKDAPASQQKTQNTPLTLSNTRPTREKASAGTYSARLNPNDGGQTSSILRAARTTTYSFTGWNTAADGSGTGYAPGASYTADADVTLYAQWESTTTAAPITLPELARDDAVFKGWTESRDAESGVMGEYTPTGNVTLYAIWLKADFVLPASLNIVESEAFRGGAFTYVYIPETVERIDGGAFASCPKLACAQFAGADTEIDGSAFDGVTGLTIIAPGGSTAEAFASAHGFDFMPAA